MTYRFTGLLILLTLLANSPGWAQSPNFYLPEPEIKTEAKKEPTKKEATPPEKPAKAEKKEQAKSEKIEPKNLKLRERKNSPAQIFDPPMDPYGLARAFQNRWDFSTFIISANEELKFRLDSARSKTLRLARAFSALSKEVEIRQRNLNSAALAAYLLSRDQNSWVPVAGRSLTEAQMLAVRLTMRQDMNAMQSALTDYESLRTTLNQSAEEVTALEKNGLKSIKANELEIADRPTVPTTLVAENATRSVLEKKSVSLGALKATLAAENLSSIGDKRQSISSFAPPPPGGAKLQESGNRVLDMPTAKVSNEQPRGESMKRPDQVNLVFDTTSNAPVHSVKKGMVVYAGPFRGYGDMVIVEHEKGTFSIYSHLGAILVREREAVKAGTIIGRAGNPPELGHSGIHFQVRKGKIAVKPDQWLGKDQTQKLLTRG